MIEQENFEKMQELCNKIAELEKEYKKLTNHESMYFDWEYTGNVLYHVNRLSSMLLEEMLELSSSCEDAIKIVAEKEGKVK